MKNIIGLLVAVVLVVGLVVGVQLVQQQTQLKSKASGCEEFATPRADVCDGKLSVYDSCEGRCVDGKKLYFCTASQNSNCTTPDGVWCSIEDSECGILPPPPLSPQPAPAPPPPPAGGTGGNVGVSTCPLANYQNVSNEVLIEKCRIEELGKLPNERLETFPKSIFDRFSNERLDDFSLTFLATLTNDRLLKFSNDFLIKFPNEVLLRFSNDRLITFPFQTLKTFPESRIRTFPCDIQEKLGFSCSTDVGTTAPPPGVTPDKVMFRIADGEDETDALTRLEALGEAGYQEYSPSSTTSSMLLTHNLAAVSPGKLRYVAVQFKKGTDIKKAVVKTIKFIGAKPTVTNTVCEYTPEGEATKVTINGLNFGASQGSGKVVKSGKDADSIDSWQDKQVVVTFKEKISGKFKVKLLTSDGQETAEQECAVGLTTVNFSVTSHCNLPLTADNVEVKIFENTPQADPRKPFVAQKIRVSANKPQSFEPNLQANKDYSIIVKAPKTLAKRVDFKTSSGTTNLDDVKGAVGLHLGDVAPLGAPDGRVNSADVSLMFREWIVGKSASGRVTDFNGDGQVNSIDYSCIKKDFDANRSDETFSPPKVTPTPTPTPTPSPSPSPTPAAGAV